MCRTGKGDSRSKIWNKRMELTTFVPMFPVVVMMMMMMMTPAFGVQVLVQVSVQELFVFLDFGAGGL